MLTRRGFLGGVAATAATPACDTDKAPDGRSVASLWFTYGGKNREVLEKLVRRFNTSQARHYVRAVFQGDYFEGLAKLRTAIAARAAPSLSHVVGEVVPYLAEAGVLEAMDDYPGFKGLDIIPELGQSKSWIGGDRRPTVALPFNRSTPICYLNGPVFSRAGLTAPRTWGELREVARRLTIRDGSRVKRHGFGCPVNWWFWVALLQQAGGEVVEADGRVTLGGEAGVRATELWQTLVNVDRSMKPPPGRDYNAWEATNQDYLAGRVAMIWTSTAFLRYLEENAAFEVVAAPLPKDVRHAVPTGGTHWVLMKSAPAAEKQSAWAFLRFMHEPEQVITWATETGYMPVTYSAVKRLEQSGYYRKHPNDRVAYDQLTVARPWPWSRDLFRIQRETVQPRLESAVLSGENARTLLREARAELGGQR
ncbi:MAG TPA: ABC transporter substrate-binding protein [Polyangiaceae bacterium]